MEILNNHMGRFIVKHPDHVRRAQRLALFCKEVKRAILSLCIDHDVSTRGIDPFMEQFVLSMEFSENDFENVTLLMMLLDETFVTSTFETFRYNPLTE
jgi:hypothetical protein